jgi:hypothetical protein
MSELQGYPVHRDKIPEACRLRLIADESRKVDLMKNPKGRRRHFPFQTKGH